MKTSPSLEFRKAFPTCPVAEVQETDRTCRKLFGWLDVVKFDEWLQRVHGFDPNFCTLEFVREKWGDAAAKVLEDEL